MNSKTRTVSERTRTFELDALDLLHLIRKDNMFPIPAKLEKLRVFIRVPGGGDYSNMDLEVDDHCPIVVEVCEKEETET
jgi:hypothetical protein